MLVKTGLSHTSAVVGPCLWGRLHGTLACLLSLPSCCCLDCHRWTDVHPLRVLCAVREGKKGDWTLTRDSAVPVTLTIFQQDLYLCMRCIASRNKKAAIQFLPLYLVTGDTQSIGTDNHNRYTASHGLQAAPEKMQA